MDEVVAKITQATKEWGEAFRSGEISDTMAFLAPDAVLIPPNQPALVGTKATEAWAKGMFEAVTIQDIAISVDGVRVADGWAVSHGEWHMTMAAGETIMRDTTRYVVIWERQTDGSWKVAHDVWNSSLPLEPDLT
jgi:ketosteroid isomerase-like protein